MAMDQKRANKLASDVYKRKTGSKKGALGDLRDYGSVSLEGADAAADSVDRQRKIENAQDKRQKANSVQRAGQLAAEKIAKRKKQKEAFAKRGIKGKAAFQSPSGRDN